MPLLEYKDKDSKQVTELDYSYEILNCIEILNLSYYINLQILNLWGNKISKIEGLEKLVNLHTLYLRNNQITQKTINAVVNRYCYY